MRLPPYTLFPHLKNSTLLLREVHAGDLNDLVEISFYNRVKADSLQQALEMQEKINADYMDGNCIHWVIVEATRGRVVGTCGYYRGFANSSGELGCILLPQFRGMGYMTPAMQLAIDFGRNEMELKRIWAATSKENDKAKRLLDRSGFVFIKDLPDNDVEYELAI